MRRGKQAKQPVIKALAKLSEEDRIEYQLRHRMLIDAGMQFKAAGLFEEQWRDHVTAKYGLPQIFDLDLNTGIATERMEEATNNAQNGRV